MQAERAEAANGRTGTRFALVWIACAALLLAGPLCRAASLPEGQDVGIEAFYGTFHGSTVHLNEEGLTPRDLNVTITPDKDRSFVVSWTTIIRKRDGDKRKQYTIAFKPTQRPGVYSSAMRSNVFGGREALDPFKGDPLIWARLQGKTLTVCALIILDDGGYDLQIYDRTLTPAGLDLRFTRSSNAAPTAALEASLVREANQDPRQ